MKKMVMLSMICIPIMLSGCGNNFNSLTDVPVSSGVEIPPPNPGSDGMTVIASTKMNINIQQGVAVNGLTSSTASSSIVLIPDVTVPAFVTYDVTSNIAFNVLPGLTTDASGAININVYYNDVAQTGLNKVSIQARMLNYSGLIGSPISTTVIPIQFKTEAMSVYSPVSSGNTSVMSWPKPYTSVISENISIKLRADFTQAIAQQYTGTVVLELVKEIQN